MATVAESALMPTTMMSRTTAGEQKPRKGLATVTTTGNEVSLAGGLEAAQSLRHGGSF